MAEIHPVSELQREIGKLTTVAKETKEPVYLTKNGSKHLVLIDAETFDEILKRAQGNGTNC